MKSVSIPPPDLRDKIDQCIGSPPRPLPPVELLVKHGRRLRRRRRAAMGLAAATAAAAAVSGAALLSTGSTTGSTTGTGRDGFASQPPDRPTTPASGSPTTAPPSDSNSLTERERERRRMLSDRAVTFEGNGRVRLAPGATETRAIDNPYKAIAPAWSEGVAVSYRGYEFWYAMSGPGDGSVTGGTQYVVDVSTRAAFLQFVESDAPKPTNNLPSTTVGPDVWPDVVTLDPAQMTDGGEGLTAQPGFSLLDQRAHIKVGAAWASHSDDTAAGLARAADGISYYVLARRFDSKPAQYVVVRQTGNGVDLGAFIRLARQRYTDVG